MNPCLQLHKTWAQDALKQGHTLQAQTLCRYALQHTPLCPSMSSLWHASLLAPSSIELKRKRWPGLVWKLRLKFLSPTPSMASLRRVHNALQYYPKCAHTLRLWARSAQALGAQELACTLYERLIKHAPHTPQDYLSLCGLYHDIQHPDKALLCAEAGLHSHPECRQLQSALQHASLQLSLHNQTYRA